MICKKVSFASEEYAEFYLNKLRTTSKRELKPVEVYLCEKCFTWHLTSRESKEKMQLLIKEGEIKNLKKKIYYLQSQIEKLKKSNLS